MPVMGIGKMRVGVDQWLVSVWMAVLRSRRDRIVVLMLMMFAMEVLVIVLHRLMHVLVTVPLREVQPYAHDHEAAGDKEPLTDWLLQQWNCQHRAKKGGYREIGPGARRSQMPQSHHK